MKQIASRMNVPVWATKDPKTQGQKQTPTAAIGVHTSWTSALPRTQPSQPYLGVPRQLSQRRDGAAAPPAHL